MEMQNVRVGTNQPAANCETSPRPGRITQFPSRALCRNLRRVTRCLQRAASMTVESRRKTLLLDHRGLRLIPAFSLLLSLTTFGKLFKTFYFFRLFLFIYFWLLWIFLTARGLSPVEANRSYSWLRCSGFSLRQLLLLRCTGSRVGGLQELQHTGSVVAVCRLSCFSACGIFLD